MPAATKPASSMMVGTMVPPFQTAITKATTTQTMATTAPIVG